MDGTDMAAQVATHPEPRKDHLFFSGQLLAVDPQSEALSGTRRRSNKRQAAAIDTSDEVGVHGKDLLVFGYHARLFRDDVQARQQHLRQAMMPLFGDPSVLVDRFDARSLLDGEFELADVTNLHVLMHG